MGLVALASSLLADAQESPSLTADLASVDSSHYPNLSAVVNVVDNNGRPVPALASDSFSATVDGQPAHVQGVQMVVDSQLSLAVVLVVDVSGSMAGQPLAAAQSAAAEFVNALSPQDTVAVLSFNDEVTTVQQSTSDKAKAISSLQALTAGGNTALFEATSQGVAQAVESKSLRPVIILLSDGVDYGGKSTVSRDESIAQARSADIPVYTIALGSDVDKAYLTELAQATGARFLETPSPEGLSQLYTDIGALLRGQYVVSLQAPDLPAAASHTLELSVTTDGVTAVASKVLQPAQSASVTVDGLAAGGEVKNAVTLTVQVAGAAPSQVQFFVDGAVIATVTAPPYQLTLDPKTLQIGAHTLRVEASDSAGVVASSEAAFSVPVLETHSNKARVSAGLVSIAAALGIVYIFSRRRSRLKRGDVRVRLGPLSNGPAVAVEPEAPPPALALEPAEEFDGKLVVVAGPNAGQEYKVGVSPRSIGSADWCEISLEGYEDVVGPEEARVWVHQGKLVYHKLARLSLLASDEAVGGWLILENGDEVEIGPFRFHFVFLDNDGKREETPAPMPSVLGQGSSSEIPPNPATPEPLPQRPTVPDEALVGVAGNVIDFPAPPACEPEQSPDMIELPACTQFQGGSSAAVEPAVLESSAHGDADDNVVEFPTRPGVESAEAQPDVIEPFVPPLVGREEPRPETAEATAPSFAASAEVDEEPSASSVVGPVEPAPSVPKPLILPPFASEEKRAESVERSVNSPAEPEELGYKLIEPPTVIRPQQLSAWRQVEDSASAPPAGPLEAASDIVELPAAPTVQPAETYEVIELGAASVESTGVGQTAPDPDQPRSLLTPTFAEPPAAQGRQCSEGVETAIELSGTSVVQPVEPPAEDAAARRSLGWDDDPPSAQPSEPEDEEAARPGSSFWVVDGSLSENPFDYRSPEDPDVDDADRSSTASA